MLRNTCSDETDVTKPMLLHSSKLIYHIIIYDLNLLFIIYSLLEFFIFFILTRGICILLM